ncbi:hypothetical protein AZE42_12000, partial [Rhizopogon vesiculosus]
MHHFSLRYTVIMASHGNIAYANVATTEYGKEIGKIQAPPVWNTPEGIQVDFLVVPLYHSLGFHIASFNFIKPTTIVILPKWNIDVFFDSIPKYHITTLMLVPSLIHQIVHHPRSQTADLSSVKTIGSAAAHLPPQLSEQLLARFPHLERVGGGYGLSEFTMPVTMRPLPGMLNGRAKDKPGSVGILFPGVEARIIRPDGSLAGPNEAGELLVRGAATVLGYKGNEKATRETFVDGWVRTGDRMRIDEEG